MTTWTSFVAALVRLFFHSTANGLAASFIDRRGLQHQSVPKRIKSDGHFGARQLTIEKGPSGRPKIEHLRGYSDGEEVVDDGSVTLQGGAGEPSALRPPTKTPFPRRSSPGFSTTNLCRITVHPSRLT